MPDEDPPVLTGWDRYDLGKVMQILHNNPNLRNCQIYFPSKGDEMPESDKKDKKDDQSTEELKGYLEKDKQEVFNLKRVFKIISDGYQVYLIEKFLKEKTEFFIAPASTSISKHGCKEGGLLEHTLNVCTIAYEIHVGLNLHYDVDYTLPDLLLAALMHDIGKAHPDGYYIKHDPPKPKKLYYKGDIAKIPHAHLSVMMLKDIGIDIPVDVIAAILIHNGMFTGTGQEVMSQHNHSLLALCLHSADMMSLKFEK
jgi:putative nucleotidyltransferase with HDIG domain